MMKQIASELGKTKNSIIGRLVRLRTKGVIAIEQPNRTHFQNGKPRVRRPTKPRRLKLLPMPVMALVEKPKRVRLKIIESHTAVTFAELQPHHCRFPFGDPKRSDFRFCGCTKLNGTPYCAEHTRIAGRQYEEKRVA